MTRHMKFWSAIASLALLGTSCGTNGQSSNSSTPDSTDSEESTTTQEPETIPIGSSTCTDVLGGVALYNDDLQGEPNSDLLRVSLESDGDTLLVTWVMGGEHYPAENAFRRHWAVTAFDANTGARSVVLGFNPDAEDQAQRLTITDLTGSAAQPLSVPEATDTIADSRIGARFPADAVTALPDKFAWSGSYILESLDPPSEYHSFIDEQDDCPRETRGDQAIVDDLPVFPNGDVTEPTTTTTLPPTTTTTAPPCPFHGAVPPDQGGDSPQCLLSLSEANSFIEFVGINAFAALGYEYDRSRDLSTSFCDFPVGLVGPTFQCEFELPSGYYAEAIARFTPTGDIVIVQLPELPTDRD